MDEIEDEDTGGYRKPRPWPLWVSMCLWGVPGREWARVISWGSVAIAIGCVAYGFVSWPFFAGGVFALVATWFHAAIRWVDQHSEWP